MKILSSCLIALSTLLTTNGQAAIQELPLKNGAFLIGEQDKSLPRNHIRLTYQGGAALLSPENQGVAQVLALTFDEGPTSMSAKTYKEKLFKLGASIGVSISPLSFSVHVVSLPETQAEVFKLVAEVLAKPRINESEFKRLHAKQLQNTKSDFESMRSVISYVSARHMFDYAPQIMNGDSSPATFAKLDYKTFKAEYNKLLVPSHLVVGYVGPDTVESIKTLVEKEFADHLKTKAVIKDFMPLKIPSVSGVSYVLIDKPGATDNQLLFMFPQNIKRDGAEWIDGRIVQDILGGGTSGKLGDTLRTQRGLTYGAMSWFKEQQPNWQAWTFGGVEQTKGLLTGVPEVVAKFQATPISQKSMDQAKSRILNAHKSEFELAGARLEETMWYRLSGFNIAAFENFESDLNKAKLNSVNRFHKNLQTRNAVVYIMGDKAKILPILGSIGVDATKVKIVSENEIK